MKYFIEVGKNHLDGKITEDQAKVTLLDYYKDINQDVVKYVLIRHLSCYDFFKQFEYLNLLECEIKEITLTTEEVLNKLEYAEKCTWRDESDKYYEGFKNEEFYKYYHLNNTWQHPIVLTEIDDKYIAIDGNSRLRILRCYLKNSGVNVDCLHKAYLIVRN